MSKHVVCPKLPFSVPPPPCKNWGGRTTYTTHVTASPFYLLGEDLSILALLPVRVYFRHLLILTPNLVPLRPTQVVLEEAVKWA